MQCELTAPCGEKLNHISWTRHVVFILQSARWRSISQDQILPVCEQRLFHTAYSHYIAISLLPLLCGGKIRVPFPSLVFNHQPRRGPMLTQQLQYGAVQQSITSKWALLDIWQHSGSYTQLPPVLLSLSAPRLNTEKSYSFIFIFFLRRMLTISKPFF